MTTPLSTHPHLCAHFEVSDSFSSSQPGLTRTSLSELPLLG